MSNRYMNILLPYITVYFFDFNYQIWALPVAIYLHSSTLSISVIQYHLYVITPFMSPKSIKCCTLSYITAKV